MLQRLEAALLSFTHRWWVWPATLVILGVGALIGSLVFAPGEGQTVNLWMWPLPGTCTFLEWTGQPCPSCGMTRSWVNASRGHWVRAFTYNPAGVLLWLSLLVGGVLGAIRLFRGDPRAFRVPYRWLSVYWTLWILVAYSGVWIARLLGWLPDP